MDGGNACVYSREYPTVWATNEEFVGDFLFETHLECCEVAHDGLEDCGQLVDCEGMEPTPPPTTKKVCMFVLCLCKRALETFVIC